MNTRTMFTTLIPYRPVGMIIAAVATFILSIAATAPAITHDVPGTYPTIQAAVDAAAPGDTVAVAAGVYEEQVVITTDIVLLGAGSDATTVQAPPVMPFKFGVREYRAVICAVDPATVATVAGLTIDGLQRQPDSGAFVGLSFYHCGGEIRDVRVLNVHPWPATDQITGIGVLASGLMGAAPKPISITDVEVLRYQKVGLVVAGPYHAVLENVRTDPDGVYSDSVQNGIELDFVHSARVTGCEVHNVYYDGDPYPDITSVGLLAYFSDDVVVTDSRTDRCQTGIYLLHSPFRLESAEVVAIESSPGFSQGLVSIDFVGFADAAAGMPWTMPRPLIDDAPPPSRPQYTYPVTVRDCTFDGSGNPLSRGIAVISASAEALILTVERCLLRDWETGVTSLEGGIGAVYGRLSGCRFEDNSAYGAFAATISPLDARGSTWGHASGPYHPAKNPLGMGDTVSDDVLFDPWLTGNVAPLPAPQTISLGDYDGAAYTDTLTVEYLGGADDALYAFSALVEWDPAVVDAVSIRRPSRGGFADAVAFQVLPTTGGATIDAALGGARPGITSGPLCTIEFAATGTPDWTPAAVTVSLLQARNTANQPVTGFSTDAGELVVDLQAPRVYGATIVNETLAHTDEFAKNGDLVSMSVVVEDGDPMLGRGAIRGIPGHLWGSPYLYTPPDAYVGTLAIWAARPAFLTPTDGPAPFFAEARDPSGNLSPITSDTLTADNTVPAPVSGLQATPGHNAIGLAWDDATGSDLNYRRTLVRGVRWHDYPWYDGAAPDYPTLPGDGEAVYEGDDITVDLAFAADGSQRDILRFGAMVEDMAGNVSAADVGSRAEAVNYRLGDVRGHDPGSPGDGLVDIYDVDRLGDTYGLLRGEIGFDGECDVAPVNGNPGVPLPDEAIDLDDLMVFADQFELDQAAPPAEGGAALPQLVWRAESDDTWVLELLEPCPRLKGLSLRGEAPAGVSLTLAAGPLLHAQPGPWFLHPGRGGLEAHVAMLGHGVGLAGSGVILSLRADGPATLPAPVLDLRDIDLQPMGGDSPTAVDDRGAADVPRVFRAGPAYPNPFNPSTDIAFDLPAARHVTVSVYDAAGRLVAMLLDDRLPAARHTTRWTGCDRSGRPVAAGTYIWRLEAGPWSASGKLQLVK